MGANRIVEAPPPARPATRVRTVQVNVPVPIPSPLPAQQQPTVPIQAPPAPVTGMFGPPSFLPSTVVVEPPPQGPFSNSPTTAVPPPTLVFP